MLILRFSRKVSFFTLLTLVSFSLVFRSDLIYQHGGDTLSIAGKIASLILYGEGRWILHPLSNFGWYPFSYPSGSFFFLGSVSLISGIDLVSVVYILPTFFSIFGILAMFLLARRIYRNLPFVFLTLLAFMTSEVLILHTWSNISTRGLFMVFYPIVIYFMLNLVSDVRNKVKWAILASITTIVLFSVHRIAFYFLGMILLPYILLVLINYVQSKTNLKFKVRGINYSIISIAIIIIISQVMGYAIKDFTYSQVSRHQEHLIPGEGVLISVMNLVADYGVRTNVSIVLAPLGFLYVLFFLKESFSRQFMITTTLFSLFAVVDIKYFLYFFSSILSLYVALGFIFLYNLIRNNQRIFYVPIFLAIAGTSLQFTLWYLEREYHLLVLISMMAFGLILFATTFEKIRVPRSKIAVSVIVSMIVISLTFALSISTFKSFDLRDDFENGEGKVMNEYRLFGSGFWVGEYSQEIGWSSDLPSTISTISILSKNPSVTDSNDIIGNQLLISEMDPQFNFTRPWASQRYFFESESLEWVHDPSAVSKSILTKPNDELAKLYGVNWIIYTYRDNSLPDPYQANSFVIFDNGLTYVVNVYD